MIMQFDSHYEQLRQGNHPWVVISNERIIILQHTNLNQVFSNGCNGCCIAVACLVRYNAG